MNPISNSDCVSMRSAIRGLVIVLGPVATATVAADYLLWGGHVGVSLGLFLAFIGTMLLLIRRGRMRTRLLMVVAALAATCVQAGIEISLSNFLVGATLVLVLGGEAFQSHLVGLWGRFSEAIFGLLAAPFRWFGFTGTVTRHLAELSAPNLGLVGSMARGAWVLAPAVILLIIFASIFSAGNAIFAEFTARLWTLWLDRIASLDLSVGRFVFWAFAATAALGIFHGAPAPDSPRWWTRTLPRIPRPDYRLASWQTGAVFIALNGLFFAVNTIDAAYLWRSGRLPGGVNHTQFVHDGVWSLIGAVVFSAVIIAGMFQQQDRVLSGRWLKNLAHLWVAQNAVLIAGVFLRLKLYVEEYQLTEKRIYVGAFLLLVAFGFLFLGWFVEKRRTFNWLLGRSMVATFVLFFVLQFLDVAGFVARHNVARWLSSSQRGNEAVLDVEYLVTLGPSAWPQLALVASSKHGKDIRALAAEKLAGIVHAETAAATTENWREWQWRRAKAREALNRVR